MADINSKRVFIVKSPDNLVWGPFLTIQKALDFSNPGFQETVWEVSREEFNEKWRDVIESQRFYKDRKHSS